MSDIVISYAREDKKKARLLADKLMASGWSVWWDRDMLGGQDYDMAIESELEMARCVIVIWSALSVKSHFVRDEANAALAKNKLVPVSFDETEPPLGFRMTHIIKFEVSNNISDDDYSRLYHSIVKKAGEPGDSIPLPPPPKKASKVGWLLLGLAAATVIIFFIVSGINKRNPGQDDNPGKSTKDRMGDSIAHTMEAVTEMQSKNELPISEPPITISFLKGTWRFEWYFSDAPSSELARIDEGGRYYINDDLVFMISDFQYDKSNQQITFTKTSTKDNRILHDNLSVVNNKLLIGTEETYKVQFTKLSD